MDMDIFKEMADLRREIDGAFKGFGMGSFLEPSFLPGVGMQRFPQINIAKDQNNVYVEALVPGVDAKDLDLTVMRGVLTLAGERKEKTAPQCTWHRRERGHDKFMRSVDLPCDIDINKVVANFSNGILFVTLPVQERAKPKKITVRTH